MNTCCGTHVSNLSELQMIKFVGTEPKKGMVRVSFLAGNRVFIWHPLPNPPRPALLTFLRARQLSRAVSAWSEREKKLNVTLQCAATEHVAAATRINNDVKACACFFICTAPHPFTHIAIAFTTINGLFCARQ